MPEPIRFFLRVAERMCVNTCHLKKNKKGSLTGEKGRGSEKNHTVHLRELFGKTEDCTFPENWHLKNKLNTAQVESDRLAVWLDSATNEFGHLPGCFAPALCAVPSAWTAGPPRFFLLPGYLLTHHVIMLPGQALCEALSTILTSF